MMNWSAGAYRICPLCEARNKAGETQCAKCRTPLSGAAVVAARPQPRGGSDPLMRMLLIGGLLAAIGAGLVVRSILNASFESPVLSEEQVQAADAVAPGEEAAAPPPEVTGWTPGSVAPVAEPAAPPAWSTSTFPVAPVEAPSDPNTSMVGIAPSASPVREAAKRGHVFTNDDLVGTRGPDTPAPAMESAAPPPAPEPTPGRSGDSARRGPVGGSDPQSRVAAAQRRVLAIRDRARATGQDLDDEMEDAIDAVREAQKDAIRARRDQ
jgi:hypothetical protein